MNGTVDTTTILTDSYNGSNIRSAVSSDGQNIWTGGNAGSGLSASAGVRYTTLGASSATQINSTTSNMRVVKIFNGQLYVSSSTGTFLGVSSVGTGEPTTGFTGSPTPLPGMPTTGSHSAYDFFFKDANTLYIADEGTVANGGGIQKWTFNGSVWSLQYTLLNNGTTTTSVRGLAGFVEGNGNVDLFATTTASSANNLIEVVDTGVNTSISAILATAPANDVFRGVALLNPIPEPNGLFACGALILYLGRKKLFHRK